MLMFNFLGEYGNQVYGPGSKLWDTTARKAHAIVAAWGDLPTIPSASALSKLTYIDAQLKRLTNQNRQAWRTTWIPMIRARKREIAQWLNNNGAATSNYPPIGYLAVSTKNNPKHPLYLSRTIAFFERNVPLPTGRLPN